LGQEGVLTQFMANYNELPSMHPRYDIFNRKVQQLGCGPAILKFAFEGDIERIAEEMKRLRKGGMSMTSNRFHGLLGETPLMLAASSKHPWLMNRPDVRKSLIVTLLNENADPNAEDIDGETALHYAALAGLQDAADILVRHRVNVSKESTFGEKASDVAKQNPAFFLDIQDEEGVAINKFLVEAERHVRGTDLDIDTGAKSYFDKKVGTDDMKSDWLEAPSMRDESLSLLQITPSRRDDLPLSPETSPGICQSDMLPVTASTDFQSVDTAGSQHELRSLINRLRDEKKTLLQAKKKAEEARIKAQQESLVWQERVAELESENEQLREELDQWLGLGGAPSG